MSGDLDRQAGQVETFDLGRPALAWQHRKGARQRTRGDDLAGAQRRISVSFAEHRDQMRQRLDGPSSTLAPDPVSASAPFLSAGSSARKGPRRACRAPCPTGCVSARRTAGRAGRRRRRSRPPGSARPGRSTARTRSRARPSRSTARCRRCPCPGERSRSSPSTISGSMRGSGSCDTSTRSPGVTSRTVVSYMSPQIGWKTPYSAQMLRLVKPILRPTGFSPRAILSAAQLRGHRVGVGLGEAGIPCGERLDLTAAVDRRENCRGDRGGVHRA